MHTVLLIEDQPEVAFFIRLAVERAGHRAILAHTLKEAEQIWSTRKGEITVVLADSTLPDGSGITFANRLYKERPELRVIIASGMLHGALPKAFQRLDKPFTIGELTRILNASEVSPPSHD